MLVGGGVGDGVGGVGGDGPSGMKALGTLDGGSG